MFTCIAVLFSFFFFFFSFFFFNDTATTEIYTLSLHDALPIYRSGEIIRTFEVITVGDFNNDAGTLKETFSWNDGEVENRTWTLKRISENEWSGKAPDVIGTATGTINNDKLRWSYTLTLKVRGKKINLKFDDQMWMSETGVMVNHAKFSKFGLHLGDVVVSFHK